MLLSVDICAFRKNHVPLLPEGTIKYTLGTIPNSQRTPTNADDILIAILIDDIYFHEQMFLFKFCSKRETQVSFF